MGNDTVVNLFDKKYVEPEKSPSTLLETMSVEANDYDKALVILVEEVGAGMWKVHFDKVNMNNAEMGLVLDIAKEQLLSSILGG